MSSKHRMWREDEREIGDFGVSRRKYSGENENKKNKNDKNLFSKT